MPWRVSYVTTLTLLGEPLEESQLGSAEAAAYARELTHADRPQRARRLAREVTLARLDLAALDLTKSTLTPPVQRSTHEPERTPR